MIQDVLADAESRMGKAMEALRRDLGTIRTGRASPSLVERLPVDSYGTPTPLNQLAGISVPEPRLLVIQPWDRGTIGRDREGDPQVGARSQPEQRRPGDPPAIPPLTEERRKQLVKLVHNHVEEGKVAVRNIRRDAMTQVRELMNEKLISEDDERRAEHQVDDLAKRFIDEAEQDRQGQRARGPGGLTKR